MSKTRMVGGLSILFVLVMACAQMMGVMPTARYKVITPFPVRLGDARVLGIQVKSALPQGSVPASDLAHLSEFIADDLREGHAGNFDEVISLAESADPSDADMILTIEVNVFEAATQAEQKKDVPSNLHVTISLVERETGRGYGQAVIWATGDTLDLDETEPPGMVRSLASAIVEVIQ